jgi:hypothetical protein
MKAKADLLGPVKKEFTGDGETVRKRFSAKDAKDAQRTQRRLARERAQMFFPSIRKNSAR